MTDRDRIRAPRALKRDAHIIGLLFASTTSIIGSGWLFGAFHASKIAGPFALWSWVVGAAIILVIAFCFAELAPIFPRSGALVHMSLASHGEGLGRIWGWMLFLAYVAIPSVEAEAAITYAANYFPWLIRPHTGGLLSPAGFIACAALLAVLALANVLAVRLLLRINSTVTWWKIAVPLLTALALIVASSHWDVWAADPHSYTASDIFTALPVSGIVFSYFGFRTAIDLGGESANPSRDMPIAIIGSVLLAAGIYILLQIGFLVALRPSDLAQGWQHLSFGGQLGPFAGLAATLGMGWLATLLYVDAYISPSGTGLIYVTGGSRVLFAVGELDAGPRWLTVLNKAGAPWAGVLVMWIVGVFFLLPFPAWQLMVNYITSITVLTFGLGPIVLLVLRRTQPNLARPFRLPLAEVTAPLAFICCNWVIYWSGFSVNSALFIIIAIGFVVYALYYHLVAKKPPEEFGWRHIAWLLPWFGGVWVLSALSAIGGGFAVLSFWEGVVATAIWSLLVIMLALRSALPAKEASEILARMEQTA